MNIVFVADQHTDENGAKEKFGALLWVARLVSQLKNDGHNVCVIAENEQTLGVFRVPTKTHRLVNFLLKRSLVFGKCDDRIVRKALDGADIVHFTLPFALSVGVRKIAQDMGIPCVASFSCIPEDVLGSTRPNLLVASDYLYRRWHKRFYKHIDDIHCMSGDVAQRLGEHGYTASLHVIGSGASEPYLKSADEAEHQEGFEVDVKQITALYNSVIDKSESQTDAHKIHLPQTLSFKLDENYAFVNRSPLFVVPSFLFKYAIIYPIFYSVTALLLGFRAKGRRNLKAARDGAITVANHVHMLDAPMLSFSLFPRQPVITSIKGNFETPGVAFLVRILGAAPIPETPKALGAFMRAMSSELDRKRIVHFYPEASLWPGHTQLRPFKNGAFHLAVSSNKPILPMVVKPRDPTGLYKLFKKKPCITVQIGEPIAVPTFGSKRARTDAMRERTHAAMAQMLGADVSDESHQQESRIKAAQ